MNAKSFSRRAFLHRGIAFAAGAPLALRYAASGLPAEALGVKPGPSLRPDAKVAIVGTDRDLASSRYLVVGTGGTVVSTGTLHRVPGTPAPWTHAYAAPLTGATAAGSYRVGSSFAWASWRREVTPSFRNTLRRW